MIIRADKQKQQLFIHLFWWLLDFHKAHVVLLPVSMFWTPQGKDGLGPGPSIGSLWKWWVASMLGQCTWQVSVSSNQLTWHQESWTLTFSNINTWSGYSPTTTPSKKRIKQAKHEFSPVRACNSYRGRQVTGTGLPHPPARRKASVLDTSQPSHPPGDC